jgi:transcription elongation factor S-II
MEQQFMSLFELAKKSTDVVATSASIFPEVYRRWMLQTSLKRFLVTSFN